MQRINNFFFISVFFLNLNLLADINEEFVDLYVNELPCTNEFIKYIDNNELLKSDFLFETEGEVEILQSIFKSYCNGPSQKVINQISNKIFTEDIKSKGRLYAIHSAKFAYHLYETESIEALNIIYTELMRLNRTNIDELGLSGDIANIIVNISVGVDAFELTEFDKKNQNSELGYGANADRLYSLIEKFIFNIVDDTLTDDSLESIAGALFEIRIRKANNLNYYGSPLQRFGARDEIIKVYLNNYVNGSIQYVEFQNIINDKKGKYSAGFISISPTIDQVINLNTISTSFTNHNVSESGYLNDSDKSFDITMQKMLIERFEENPEKIIYEMSSRLMTNYKNIDCSIAHKEYKAQNDNIESLLSEIQLLNLKLVCFNNKEVIFEVIDKINKYYFTLKDRELSEEDLSFALMDINVMTMFFDLYLSTEFQLTELVEKDKVRMAEQMLSYKENQLKFQSIKLISSIDDIFFIQSIMMGLELIDAFIIDVDSTSKNRIDLLKNRVIDQISFDMPLIKNNLLSKTFNKSDKIFLADGITAIGMFLLNSTSKFAPEYLYLLISDFELGIEENRYKQINQFLEINSFYLDNIDTIISNTTPEFIFQIKSLDKWFVFKNLMTMEAAVKFSLASANLIPFDEYFQNSHNRANQTLLLRPDKISLEKFKSIFIEKNADLEFIDTVIKYDQLQRNYRELLESKIILSQNVFNLTAEDTSSLEMEYRSELLELQDVLFKDKENIGRLFKHEAMDDKAIHSFLDKDEGLLTFLSGNFFTIGVFYNKGKTHSRPIFLSRDGFRDKSDIIKKSFSNPGNAIPYKELDSLYEAFFAQFDLSNIKKLHIVTDEIFSGFAFHALFNNDNKKWAVDDYTFTYLSSEKLLPYLDKKKISRKDKFIGFGNPSLNKNTLVNQIEIFFNERGDLPIEKISDLYELPDSEEELVNVANYFQNSDLFFQKDATERNLFNSIDNSYNFLAFATHSVKGMNSYFNDRGLVMTPVNSQLYKDDGFLSSQEIKLLNLKNNPIILLTACNTIESQYYLSLPYSGLASSFMEAGANGVLLSLWNVDTRSSSLLNQGIFIKNNKNLYFSEALNRSVLDLKSKKEFSHPYYWAPYIYLGR